MTKLDRLDYRILEVLQGNGRIPVKRLAEMVGISVSPCWQRIKTLEKTGIIRRYTAEIAIEKLQSVQIVLAQIILEKHTREAYQVFARGVLDIPEVIECYEVTGSFDYHVKFLITGINHYNEVLERFICATSGVEKYFTYVVTRVTKDEKTLRLREASFSSFDISK
ncbi:MAG: Lrp/AsnC family transcriptional regulator [Mesorhizobium sp.]|nr:MAG: Lrp/AsnC family transcriptional regulator [Mesorhizobium sp.]